MMPGQQHILTTDHQLHHEDLWFLPGRLMINPSLWDKEDVAHWLHWAQKEYSLGRPEKGRFEMNGRALCLLTKDDFRRRCPNSGDVLYEILQCVKQHRRGPVPRPQQTPADLTNVQEPQPPTATEDKDASSAVSSLSHDHVQCPPQTKVNVQEPLNLSSQGTPMRTLHTVDGRIPECRLLWDYVYQLLCDHRYHDYIRWEDEDSLVFRVVDPNGLASLWGNHKNRENMTYEKMSRALRHYYKLNIIRKERGQRLMFRFLKLPQDIRKQQADLTESPEHSPPPDSDFTETSPTYESSKDYFEVSPDRTSPLSPARGVPLR